MLIAALAARVDADDSNRNSDESDADDDDAGDDDAGDDVKGCR